ncbi:putative PHD type zinc finger protein with BAH domain-containing protein [Microbotryomycetes sp. JL221]|nr:putative PHD type zinc finger protein with BAH domain-containing protein [Microbotryomycetes sp. JL221]
MVSWIASVGFNAAALLHHVLVSAPWSERDGEPYHVARVLEFLPAPIASTSNGPSPEPRLRVAYYQRPRDISTRYFADFRLLFASMNTDVVPLSYVRSVVTVTHKEQIKDLSAYRRKRDAFYFAQCGFGPYAEEIDGNQESETLVNRTGPTRKQTPPEAGSHSESKTKGKGKSTPQLQTDGDSRKWRTFNGWPFRYYGMHTNNENIFDPLDSLYPKAKTRLGPRFQAVVPDWNCETARVSASDTASNSRAGTPFAMTNKPEKPGRKRKAITLKPEPVRGRDEELAVICQPSKVSAKLMDATIEKTKQMPIFKRAGVDALDRALSLLMECMGNKEVALGKISTVTQAQLGHALWSEADKRKMNAALVSHESDLQAVAKAIPGKRTKDVVKRYYIHIGHLKQEESPQQPEEKAAAAVSAKSTVLEAGRNVNKSLPSSAPQVRHKQSAEASDDDEGSLYGFAAELDKRSVAYGIQYPPRTDDSKNIAVLKLADGTLWTSPTGSSDEETSELLPALVAAEQPTDPLIKPCVICSDRSHEIELAQCKQCTLSVHASCYGIPENVTTYERWLCDLCAADKRRDLPSLRPKCILCPYPTVESITAPLTALDCLKETDAQNYVHLICAIWHPELKFSEPNEFRFVEGITDLPYRRVRSTCEICNEKSGACLKCTECAKPVHMSCAWQAGYKFAFSSGDVANKSTKHSKSNSAAALHKRGATLSPSLWCPDHKLKEDQHVVELADRDEETQRTALQIYVQMNKEPKPVDSYPLLRQARRLDGLCQPAMQAIETASQKSRKRRRSNIVVDTLKGSTSARGSPGQDKTRATTTSIASTTLPISATKIKALTTSVDRRGPARAAPSTSHRLPNAAPTKATSSPAKKPAQPAASAETIVRRSGRVTRPVSWASDMFITTLPDFDEPFATFDAPVPATRGQGSKSEPIDTPSKAKGQDAFEPSDVVMASPSASNRPRRARRPPAPADSPPLPSVQARLHQVSQTEHDYDDEDPDNDGKNLDSDFAGDHRDGPRSPATLASISLQNAILPPFPMQEIVDTTPAHANSYSPSALDTSEAQGTAASALTSPAAAARPGLVIKLARPPPQPASTTNEPPRKKRVSLSNQAGSRPGEPQVCTNCGTQSSPMFRRGPNGATLCNACGLYLNSHGVSRPLHVTAHGGRKRHVDPTQPQSALDVPDRAGGSDAGSEIALNQTPHFRLDQASLPDLPDFVTDPRHLHGRAPNGTDISVFDEPA